MDTQTRSEFRQFEIQLLIKHMQQGNQSKRKGVKETS